MQLGFLPPMHSVSHAPLGSVLRPLNSSNSLSATAAMAFVPFGRKKVSNLQQPNPSGDGGEGVEAEDGPLQQDPQVQDAHNDVEGFKISEVAMDDGQLSMGGDYFPGAPFCESPTFADKQLLEQDGGGIPQILEHNLTLRRNFDDLKQLHLQLAEANAQLQEAFLRLQDDKRLRHVKELTLLKSEHDEIAVLASELEQRNRSLEKKMASMKGENRDLIHKLDSARMEKEKVLVAKHSAELEFTRELSVVKVDDHTFRQQAADLAHKCKHLEIDLEKAVAAGDTVHQQLVALTYEKDSTIMDLEQALRRVREDLQAVERRRKENESDWQVDRQKLLSKLEDKERQESLFKSTTKEETDQRLKEAFTEAAELRAKIMALEKPRAEVELLHMEVVKELTKECDRLRQELGTASSTQKEGSDRLTEMEQMRMQLNDAQAQNREYFLQMTECRKSREELDKTSGTLKLQLSELCAIQNQERNDHSRQLEDAQRKWAAEKSNALLRTERTIKEAQKNISYKNYSLKKKLKQTQKLLATMTLDHNQLLLRLRESEAQLTIAQSTRSNMCHRMTREDVAQIEGPKS